MESNYSIRSGIDNFLIKGNHYSDLRIGLVTNDAARTTDLILSRLALLKNDFRITKLFSPEHGISSAGEDGVFQGDLTDGKTGLPVISLYADKLIPGEKDLDDIDLLLFDLPDIGCRFYTYQWTLSYIMEACAAYDKPLVVLDRPNPLSGDLDIAEGPMLDETNCQSFIGRWNIPLRHSLTIGELALYWNKSRNLQIELSVIPVSGWQRDLYYDDLKIAFVPTSPGIPDFETALVYPGMGLLEGINISEGRGTATPFKIFGAPFINAQELSNAFDQLKAVGISAYGISFTPTWGKYENEVCHGLSIRVTDKRIFKPVKTGFLLINLLFNLYPGKIKEHLYKTLANPSGKNHMDKLTGINNSLQLFQQPLHVFQEQLPVLTSAPNWVDTITPFLLY